MNDLIITTRRPQATGGELDKVETTAKGTADLSRFTQPTIENDIAADRI